MNTDFKHGIPQKLLLFVLCCIGHSLAGLCILFVATFAALGSPNLFVFLVILHLVVGIGFGVVQILLFTFFAKDLDTKLWLLITIGLALTGAILGFLFWNLGILPETSSFSRGLLESLFSNFLTSSNLFLYAMPVLLPTIGQWWLLRNQVRFAWVWLIGWFVSMCFAGLYFNIEFEQAWGSSRFPDWMPNLPVLFVILSGLTMLFIISAPRVSKDKIKNEAVY